LASIRLGQSLRSFPRLIPAHFCSPGLCFAKPLFGLQKRRKQPERYAKCPFELVDKIEYQCILFKRRIWKLAIIIDVLFLLVLSIGVVVLKLFVINGDIYTDIQNKASAQFFDITILLIIIVMLLIGSIIKYLHNSNKSKLFIFSTIPIIVSFSIGGCFETYDNNKLLGWWILFAFLLSVSLFYLIYYFRSIKIENINNYNNKYYLLFLLAYILYYIIVDIVYPIINSDKNAVYYVSTINQFIFMLSFCYIMVFYIKPTFIEKIKINIMAVNVILTLISINGLIILSQFIFFKLYNKFITILNIFIMLIFIIFAIIALCINIKIYKKIKNIL
jgi:hypothetical protein